MAEKKKKKKERKANCYGYRVPNALPNGQMPALYHFGFFFVTIDFSKQCFPTWIRPHATNLRGVMEAIRY